METILILAGVGALVLWTRKRVPVVVPVGNPQAQGGAILIGAPQPVPDGPSGIMVPNNPNTSDITTLSNGLVPLPVVPREVARFASPGIDDTSNIGVFNSGAAFPPQQAVGGNDSPSDWSSENTTATTASGGGVGSIFPKSQPASSLRTRRRGVTIWGGFWPHQRASEIGVKSGGTSDTNTGLSRLIAGGNGAASSMVRTHGSKRVDRGMKLPQTPRSVVRGGQASVPAGGAMFGQGLGSPTMPQVFGFPSVISVLANPKSFMAPAQPADNGSMQVKIASGGL